MFKLIKRCAQVFEKYILWQSDNNMKISNNKLNISYCDVLLIM